VAKLNPWERPDTTAFNFKNKNKYFSKKSPFII
jgi:hypothetical protein